MKLNNETYNLIVVDILNQDGGITRHVMAGDEIDGLESQDFCLVANLSFGVQSPTNGRFIAPPLWDGGVVTPTRVYGFYCDNGGGFLHDSKSVALEEIEKYKGYGAHTLEVRECVPEETFEYHSKQEGMPTIGDVLHCHEIGKVIVVDVVSTVPQGRMFDIPQDWYN